MRKISTLLMLLMASTILLSSCGVMFGGSRYNGTIVVKDHPNAEIFVAGQKIGTGTATSLFPRNKPLTVQVKETGCEPKTQTFDKAFRVGNFILSAAMWGIIGLGIDLGTGASYKPAHKTNPAIQKVSDKDYTFNFDFQECKTP